MKDNVYVEREGRLEVGKGLEPRSVTRLLPECSELIRASQGVRGGQQSPRWRSKRKETRVSEGRPLGFRTSRLSILQRGLSVPLSPQRNPQLMFRGLKERPAKS